MGKAEDLEAELEMVRLEEELVKAKGTKAGADPELKDELREARRVYREAREATGEGQGTANPGPLKANAKARGN